MREHLWDDGDEGALVGMMEMREHLSGDGDEGALVG